MAKRSTAEKRPTTPHRDADDGAISPEELQRLRSGCDRALGGIGLRTTADVLAEITALPAE